MNYKYMKIRDGFCTHNITEKKPDIKVYYIFACTQSLKTELKYSV